MTENNFQIDSAAVTDKGLSEKRPQNEDSYLEMNEYGLFVVADGVGGAQAGDVASQMATEILGEAFTNLPKNGDAEEVMKLAIERANQSIFQMSHDLPQLSTMATTIVALHVAGNIATIGHVGDSRLYRLDTKGNLYRETQDHSMVEEELRAGRLTAAQAANHPNRNVISRALGADSTVEVDMKTIMFDAHTTFFLCSDGITRHVEDTELREILQSNEKPESIVQKLKEICFERGAEDNLTAVIARVTDKVVDRAAHSTNGKSSIDLEEATIATTRSSMISETAKANALIIGNEETPTQPLQMPADETLHTAEIADKTDVSTPIPMVEKESLSTRENVSENKAVTEISKKSEIKTNPPQPRSVEKSGSGFGRFLSSLLLLLLGGVIGAGAYYLWAQNHQESAPEAVTALPPQPALSPSPIPYLAFEASRRTVDRNPQSYLETNVAPPVKAEDFYLLGRANLLTGKYAEAKKAFEEAKNRLIQVDETNGKILANEIAMSLAIINDPLAQRGFEKDVMMNNPNADAQSDSNLNANVANTNSNTATANQNTINR